MPEEPEPDDVAAIRQIIARQFQSFDWTPDTKPDWQTFESDFMDGATLIASARPAKRQSIGSFIERMNELRTGALRSFKEALLGCEVMVFGNVAVALAACENLENGSDITRNVEALLLVKDDGTWQIAAQAWDTESPGKTIPENLLAAEPS